MIYRMVLVSFFGILSLFGLKSVAAPFKDPLFRIQEEPSIKDWRYFMQLAEIEKSALWSRFQKDHKNLKDWSWAWRMGWVKSCAKGGAERCHAILNQGLVDEALVVREESVKVVGERFQGSQSKLIAEGLAKVFKNKANYHRANPLPIQREILFALHQISGKRAKQIGAKLAATHPNLQLYWTKVSKPADKP